MAAKTMATRVLGTGLASLKVSRQGFGCMALSAFYGAALPEEAALSVLQAAYDGGVTHFDTAQAYVGRDQNGRLCSNETLLGNFIQRVGRHNVTVATKFYPRRDAEGTPMFSEEIFWAALNQSLRRLKVETIDLYYLHRVYPESCVAIEDVMHLMKEAVQCGKVRCVGLSEASPRTIRRAHAVQNLTAVQQEWSLVSRDLEAEIVPACREMGIGVVSYSPVARGLLAGAFSGANHAPGDWRRSVPYLRPENIDGNARVVEQLTQIASRKGCTVSQLCIAWVEAQGAVPIPGTTSTDHAVENVGAEGVLLSAEELSLLTELGAQIQGERGDTAYMSSTFHSNM